MCVCSLSVVCSSITRTWALPACGQVDEKPSEDYSDVGGLDKQIQELVEAVVLPVTHAERFKALGIRPPKGVLLYGPPGTGKTLIARACAAQTNATFLKLAGEQPDRKD